MALQKSIMTRFGVPATYWKIGKFTCDTYYKHCTIYLYGFVNQQARLDNLKEIDIKIINCNDNNYTFNISQPLIAQMYTYIKTLEEWQDATDC